MSRYINRAKIVVLVSLVGYGGYKSGEVNGLRSAGANQPYPQVICSTSPVGPMGSPGQVGTIGASGMGLLSNGTYGDGLDGGVGQAVATSQYHKPIPHVLGPMNIPMCPGDKDPDPNLPHALYEGNIDDLELGTDGLMCIPPDTAE